jgi:hypothetical protein
MVRWGPLFNYCHLLHLFWLNITIFTFSHVLGSAIKIAIFRKTPKVDKQPSKTCPTELKLGPRVQGVSLAFF